MIPLGIIFFLLLIFLLLFYGLQKYVVYGQDGVYLDFNKNKAPSEQTGPQAPSGVTAEIVYDEADYSDVATKAGEDLKPIKALYLSAEAVTPEKLTEVSALLEDKGANALVLEMKNAKGALSWNSSVALAASYGTNGTADLTEAIKALKEKNVYLVARISCGVDEYMATRNAPIALATTEGKLYSDDSGVWLDLTNTAVRNYVSDISKALIDIGFDEIMLADFKHPTVPEGTALSYSQQGSTALTPEIIISSFALSVRDAVEDKGGKLSVLCDANSFRNNLADQTGQDPEVFGKVFDRYYWVTDGNTISSDKQVVSKSLPGDSLAARFVPIIYSTDSSESWMYPYA